MVLTKRDKSAGFVDSTKSAAGVIVGARRAMPVAG